VQERTAQKRDTIGEYETQYTIPEGKVSSDGTGRGAGGVQGELFTPQGSEITPSPSPRVKLVQTGTFQTGITQATTPEDIAHIAAPLRKEAQESLVAVVTGNDGQVLSVIRHTVGGNNSSQVYPGVLSGAVASIPGAKNAWFVHNHPSGEAGQGNVDVTRTDPPAAAWVRYRVKGYGGGRARWQGVICFARSNQLVTLD